MSIKLRFNVVIVRKLSIESSYPGGLEGLRTEWKPYSEDEQLIAFRGSSNADSNGLTSPWGTNWKVSMLVAIGSKSDARRSE